jgi:hypothetical protein
VSLRDVVGVCGCGLVVAGVAGLCGWAWAAITAGLPIAMFYVWGEYRKASGGRR